MWATALTRLDVALALLAIAGAIKSTWNGHVRGLIRNIQQIPAVEERVRNIEDRQEKMIDGLVAISFAESEDDYTIESERLAQDLQDGGSWSVYLTKNGQNPYADTEDEEEVAEEEPRWRGSEYGRGSTDDD